MKLYTLLATALLCALPLCALDWNPVSSGKWKKQDGEMSYEGAEFARLSAKNRWRKIRFTDSAGRDVPPPRVRGNASFRSSGIKNSLSRRT